MRIGWVVVETDGSISVEVVEAAEPGADEVDGCPVVGSEQEITATETKNSIDADLNRPTASNLSGELAGWLPCTRTTYEIAHRHRRPGE